MPLQTSTEYYGLGQSGYTAGRTEGDRALGIEGRNIGFPKHSDEEQLLEISDDERFIGAGGVPWAPDEALPADQRPIATPPNTADAPPA